MSPDSIGGPGRRGTRRVIAAALLLASGPAAAVVGGTADGSVLARSSVMVLSSKGGVCSAVVVARDVVLTAAHCASGASDHRVHYRGSDGTPVLLIPAETALHPGYSAGAEKTRRRSVDLALLRLPSSLPATFSVASLSTGTARQGDGVQVGGWGVAREGDARSTGTFRTAPLEVVEPYGPGRVLLWASGSKTGAGACQGDSGGPIANASGVVVAVTSWARGTGSRQCGELTQGVLIAPQRGWIDSILSRWSRTAAWN